MPTTCDPNNCNCAKSVNNVLPDASGNVVLETRAYTDLTGGTYDAATISPRPVATEETRNIFRSTNPDGTIIRMPDSITDFVPFEQVSLQYGEAVQISCRKEGGVFHWFVSDVMKSKKVQLCLDAPLTTPVAKDNITGNVFSGNSSLFKFHSAEKGYAVSVSANTVSASINTILPIAIGKPYPYTIEAVIEPTSCPWGYVCCFKLNNLCILAYKEANGFPMVALNEQAKIKIQYFEGKARIFKNDVLVYEGENTTIDTTDNKLYFGNWPWADGTGTYYIKDIKVWQGIA